jgi:hypothetical protein
MGKMKNVPEMEMEGHPWAVQSSASGMMSVLLTEAGLVMVRNATRSLVARREDKLLEEDVLYQHPFESSL